MRQSFKKQFKPQKNMPTPKPQYTIVLHEARKQTGLSFLEYAVAESISHLSNQPQYPWCITSRANMAAFFDLSVRGLQKIIVRLEEAGFVERNPNDQIRTTTKWSQYTILDEEGGEQSSGGVNKVQGGGEQSSYNHNNNNQLDNNNNNSGESYSNTKKSYIEVHPKNDTVHTTLVASDHSESVEHAAKRIVDKFNEVYGTQYRKISKNYLSNVLFWLDEYSVEDIEQAIVNSRQDTYWAPIFKQGGKALDLLFRKEKAKSGGGVVERVDRIGQFLSMKAPTAVRPMTDIEFYNLCKKLNVPPEHVKNHYKFLMDKAERGELKNDNDNETVEPILTGWIEKEKATGTVEECNELEAMNIDDLHPKRKAEIALFYKQSEFQRIFDDFSRLKQQFADATGDEKKEIKQQLRELAPTGKKVRAELAEATKLVKQMRGTYGVS